jgi:hypothetical protein
MFFPDATGGLLEKEKTIFLSSSGKSLEYGKTYTVVVPKGKTFMALVYFFLFELRVFILIQNLILTKKLSICIFLHFRPFTNGCDLRKTLY